MYPKTNAEGEIDENFWAQAAADQAAGRSGADGNERESPHSQKIPGTLELTLFTYFVDGDDQAIPFNTQFFHDDFDDDGEGPGFDDGDDGVGVGSVAPGAEGGEPDLMAALVGSSRRVRPQYVNYTKKAKRVDVRKLKENIWKSLDIEVPESKDSDESMVCIIFSTRMASNIADCSSGLGRWRLDRPKRAPSVRLGRLKFAKDVSEGQDAGYQHELLFHLFAPSGERTWIEDRGWGVSWRGERGGA